MVFLRQYFHTLRRIGLAVWICTILYNSLDQFIAQEIEQGLRGPDGVSSLVWFYGSFSLFVGIIFPVFLTILVLFGLGRSEGLQTPWQVFSLKNGNQLAIETLRSWGKALMAGLFFIIPGAYCILMYAFVPFIVAFSRSYQAGEVDALKYSTKLVQKHWFKILATLLGFHVLIPLSLSPLTDDYKIIWLTPIASLGISFLDALLWVLATQILYRMASQQMKDVPNEFAL